MTSARPMPSRYSRVAILFHWIIAALVIGNILLVKLSHDLPGPERAPYMALHKSIGVTILVLTLGRLLWRMGHRPPPLPASVARWQAYLSRLVHTAFYVLMIGLPITGWLWMSAAGRPIDVFGIVTLPSVAGPDRGLGDAMHETHELFGNVMLILIALHTAAAIKHQWIDRDDLLLRMWPGRTGGL